MKESRGPTRRWEKVNHKSEDVFGVRGRSRSLMASKPSNLDFPLTHTIPSVPYYAASRKTQNSGQQKQSHGLFPIPNCLLPIGTQQDGLLNEDQARLHAASEGERAGSRLSSTNSICARAYRDSATRHTSPQMIQGQVTPRCLSKPLVENTTARSRLRPSHWSTTLRLHKVHPPSSLQRSITT